MDPLSIGKLGLMAILGLKALFGGGGGSSGAQQSGQDVSALIASNPELKKMMDLQLRQAERSDPLQQALMQMSMNLLPRSAFGAFPGRGLGQVSGAGGGGATGAFGGGGGGGSDAGADGRPFDPTDPYSQPVI